jgi:hypothetical protein
MFNLESTKASWFQEGIKDIEHHHRNCHAGLTKYIETGNPVWAHYALISWLLPQWKPEPESFPLPRELLLFLFQTASAILSLADGQKPLEFRDGEIVGKAGIEITPSEACDFLPEALGLRGYKWNAFLDDRKERIATRLIRKKREARRNGASEQEAMEIVLKLAGISDARTARRKLKGGRGPRQKSPYPAPKWLHEISEEKAEPPAIADPEKAKKGIKAKTTGAKKP